MDPQWYTKAAEQGMASAQASLGLMYHMGRGVDKSEVEAVVWYVKASAQGFVPATRALESMRQPSRVNEGGGQHLYELAEQLYRGHGVKQDKAKAAEVRYSAMTAGVLAYINMLAHWYTYVPGTTYHHHRHFLRYRHCHLHCRRHCDCSTAARCTGSRRSHRLTTLGHRTTWVGCS